MTGVTDGVESYYRSLIDELDVGARLPSERSLAVQLGACRSTIRIVLTKLVAENLLQPVHGRGYYKL